MRKVYICSVKGITLHPKDEWNYLIAIVAIRRTIQKLFSKNSDYYSQCVSIIRP